MLGLVAIVTLSLATAGPLASAHNAPFAFHNHASSIRHVRRHHARAAAAAVEYEYSDFTERDDCEDGDDDDTSSSTNCTYGAWNCDGDELQRCVNNEWVSIQKCSGDNVVCSASDDSPIGCVWTWSVTNSATATGGSAAAPSSGSTTSIGNSTNYNAEDDCDEWETVECDEDGSNCTEVTETDTIPVATATATGSLAAKPTKGRHGTVTGSAGYPMPTNFGLNGTDTNSTLPIGSNSTIPGSNSTLPGYNTTLPGYNSTTNHTGNSGAPSTGAPHYVIYADNWLTSMPSASEISNYNRFILAFWMSDQGAVDDAQAWTQWSDDYRQQVIEEYHAAGISLMVSAFGSTDSPTTNGVDPTQCANDLAQFVQQYGLDGVDIDYEDMTAMNNNQAEAWLITFQQTLRSQLPQGQYLISHAPVAPWFTTANVYASGAYLAINAQVGSGIDFYNVQFYNQGDIYMDCESLMTNSGNSWPSTSVMEINSAGGVPLDKIVVGKPMDPNAADNGYMDPNSLAQCISQGMQTGWNGGVMFWEWDPDYSNGVMLTVKG